MMLTRIRPRRVLDLARKDIPAPVDMVNLIETARFDRYRWYGLFVLPALTAVGGRVLWMARHDTALAGEAQCEKLLVVRYPSHRRFLAMTLNPYYVAINTLREAGVRRFEASFTHASHCAEDLQRRKRLVGVHFTGGELSEIAAAMEAVGCELVYATRVSAALGILEPARATDPSPLAFEQLALFEPADGALPDVRAAIGGLAGEYSVHVYRREPRSTYRPSLRPSAPAAAEA